MVGVGILRVQLDGVFELCLGSRPVPVEIHFDIGERCVRFGERGIDLQGLLCRLPCSWGSIARPQVAPLCQCTVGVGEPGISECVARVGVDRFLKVLNAFLDRSYCYFLHLQAALEIKIIGFAVLGVVFDEALLLLVG